MGLRVVDVDDCWGISCSVISSVVLSLPNAVVCG